MLSSNPNLKTAEFSRQPSNHKYVVSNIRSISEHVAVEQGVGFRGEGAWPHAAPLRRAEPEEMSRFLPLAWREQVPTGRRNWVLYP